MKNGIHERYDHVVADLKRARRKNEILIKQHRKKEAFFFISAMVNIFTITLIIWMNT